MEPVKKPTQEQRKDNNLRAEIEFFDGPHEIHGEGTFHFLRRHLGRE